MDRKIDKAISSVPHFIFLSVIFLSFAGLSSLVYFFVGRSQVSPR